MPRRRTANERSDAETQREAAIIEAVTPGWERLRPRTLVDHAVEAIVACAARGLILPGDRIVEAEIARALGISRVPVREALRLLESQGLVVNEAYKGIRLVSFTQDRLKQALDVRVAPDITAAPRLVGARRGSSRTNGASRRIKLPASLVGHVDAMEVMAARGDAYGVASADAAFHRELCRLSGNEVLAAMWEQLARQFTIIAGLATFGKLMTDVVEEHRALLAVLASGDMARIERELEDHIQTQNEQIDYEQVIEERRRARRAAQARVA